MLDLVPRDRPRQASNAGSGCGVRLYPTGDLMGGCLQLIISKHQPDLAHAGQSKLVLSCLFLIPGEGLDTSWLTTKDEKITCLKH